MPYRSDRRARQAEETREAILAAARRLFAARGYAATSMGDIAAEAGVALQTVYSSVGGKSALHRLPYFMQTFNGDRHRRP